LQLGRGHGLFLSRVASWADPLRAVGSRHPPRAPLGPAGSASDRPSPGGQPRLSVSQELPPDSEGQSWIRGDARDALRAPRAQPRVVGTLWLAGRDRAAAPVGRMASRIVRLGE